MGAALRQAVADGLIPVNPVTAVMPPKADRAELAPPSAAQLVALIEAARGTTWEIPLLLACTTGARRSETLAIRWADLDLGERRLRIERGLHRLPQPDGTRKLGFLEPKSSTSRRTVKLPNFAAERRRRYRVEQNARRIQLGPGWAEGDLVCERGDGEPLDPDGLHGRVQAPGGRDRARPERQASRRQARGRDATPPGQRAPADRFGGPRALKHELYDGYVSARLGRHGRPRGGRPRGGVIELTFAIRLQGVVSLTFRRRRCKPLHCPRPAPIPGRAGSSGDRAADF